MTLKSHRILYLSISALLLTAGIFFGIIGATESQQATVEIKWQTASSLNLVEFKIYRESTADSTRVLIANLPVSAGLDPYQTHDFSYRDTSALPGITYTYLVETISADGSSSWSSLLLVQAASQGTGSFWLAGGLIAAAAALFFMYLHSRNSASGAAA